jgi:hypothetical protein
MFDYLFSMALAILFQVLKGIIKDPGKRDAFKAAMLKLRDQINLAYDSDPDFPLTS